MRRDANKAKAREAAEKDTTLSKADKLVDLYVSTLRDLQFGDADMLEKGKDDEYSHHYKTRIKGDSVIGPKKMKRLVQELAVLSTSLPLHPDSSVFLRVDEQRIDVCKVLITGPDKTPYESGCFQFDMYLESDYPKVSPKINLMTTGHGSVRFNPNLYNCGKVCLSLLGTWPGGANEEWNEETSTILQLMISIQSLIFVPEPYFNEPGYESTMNSESGRTQCRQYNENIRMQTVRWAMIDQLKNPSPGFEEIIKSHFRLKKELILEQMDTWTAEFVAHADDGPVKEFEKLVQELTRLLNSL
jgi:baculoviral IAP repeat-containing protein 6